MKPGEFTITLNTGPIGQQLREIAQSFLDAADRIDPNGGPLTEEQKAALRSEFQQRFTADTKAPANPPTDPDELVARIYHPDRTNTLLINNRLGWFPEKVVEIDVEPSTPGKRQTKFTNSEVLANTIEDAMKRAAPEEGGNASERLHLEIASIIEDLRKPARR